MDNGTSIRTVNRFVAEAFVLDRYAQNFGETSEQNLGGCAAYPDVEIIGISDYQDVSHRA